MANELRKWRKATFIHMDQKHEALQKLHDAELRIQELEAFYDESLHYIHILVFCVLLICVVSLYDNFKKYM